MKTEIGFRSKKKKEITQWDFEVYMSLHISPLGTSTQQ